MRDGKRSAFTLLRDMYTAHGTKGLRMLCVNETQNIIHEVKGEELTMGDIDFLMDSLVDDFQYGVGGGEVIIIAGVSEQE